MDLDHSLAYVNDWQLQIKIPLDNDSDEPSGAKEVGRKLAKGMQRRPYWVGMEADRWLLAFKLRDFTLAQTKAKYAVDWLTSKAYDVAVSWGDVSLVIDSLDEETLRSLNETGGSFYPSGDVSYALVELCDLFSRKGDQWDSRVKRLQYRLTGPGDKLTVKLTRPEMKAVLDLVGECKSHCTSFFADKTLPDSFEKLPDEQKPRYEALMNVTWDLLSIA